MREINQDSASAGYLRRQRRPAAGLSTCAVTVAAAPNFYAGGDGWLAAMAAAAMAAAAKVAAAAKAAAAVPVAAAIDGLLPVKAAAALAVGGCSSGCSDSGQGTGTGTGTGEGPGDNLSWQSVWRSAR